MTTMIRWNPYRNPFNLSREWGSLLENFGLSAPGRWRGEEEGAESAWLPAMDISETKDGFLIQAELPGVAKEDVKVTLLEGVLTISGEKKAEKEGGDEDRYRRERLFGSFTRSFRLPGMVAGDKVRAEYKNGVLTLTVPKAESAKPREIQIQ